MLDDIDEKILTVLSRNPRQSSIQIAKKVHISASSIRRRINKLNKSGAMQYAVYLNPEKTGLKFTTLLCLSVSEDKINIALDYLEKFPEVSWLSSSIGKYNIIAMLRTADSGDISKFVDQHINKLQGLKRFDASLCLGIRKSLYRPRIDQIAPDHNRDNKTLKS